MTTDSLRLWQRDCLIYIAKDHEHGLSYRVFGSMRTQKDLLGQAPATLVFDSADGDVCVTEGDMILCHDLSITTVRKRGGELCLTAQLPALEIYDPAEMATLIYGMAPQQPKPRPRLRVIAGGAN